MTIAALAIEFLCTFVSSLGLGRVLFGRRVRGSDRLPRLVSGRRHLVTKRRWTVSCVQTKIKPPTSMKE
jgi:hypothetical protein